MPAIFNPIERFGPHVSQVKFKPRRIIYYQGEAISDLHVVMEGMVGLTRVNREGEEPLISVIGPGGIFGEASIVLGSRASHAAYTIKKSKIALIPARFMPKMLADPESSRWLMERLCREQECLHDHVETISYLHLQEKIHAALTWLGGRFGESTPKGICLQLSVTNIARLVAGSREAVNRQISKIAKEQKYIQKRHGDSGMYIKTGCYENQRQA